jgi:hypothetical protein
MTRLRGHVVLALALAGGCDDTWFGPGGGPAGATGWCAVRDLFETSCAGCHSPAGGTQGGLDLQTDPYGAVVDAPSTESPGSVLVAAGDPAASFLLTKLEGTQGPTEGQRMPLGSPLPQATLDAVSQWIADGATEECTSARTCDDRNEQCSPGACGGEGGAMLPGSDCLSCHRAGGADEAPPWTAAGTVFSDVDGTDGLAGVTVRITGADDAVLELTTNAVGNFWTKAAIATPFHAEVADRAASAQMVAVQTTGACNSCHNCGGAAGGKLTVP